MENISNTNNQIQEASKTGFNPVSNPRKFNFHSKPALISLIIAIVSFLISFATYSVIKKPAVDPLGGELKIKDSMLSLEKFKTDEEFKSYLINSGSKNGVEMTPLSQDLSGIGNMAMQGESAVFDAVQTERYSQTNVQVSGIDEADIVKTDGENIFYSQQETYRIYDRPLIFRENSRGVIDDVEQDSLSKPNIKIVRAFPPRQMENLSQIDLKGEMYLQNDTLVVLGSPDIKGYDVSDKKNPVELWNMELEDRVNIKSSRLIDNDLYLIFQSNVNSNINCPLPLLKGENSININCTDIYRPNLVTDTDSIVTVALVDLKTGNIKEKNSFVISSSNSLVYVSNSYLYITNSFQQDFVDIFYDFILKDAKELFDQKFIDRISKLKDCELNNSTKMMELTIIVEEYELSLSDDERLKLENELQNRMIKYSQEKIREFYQTAIYKLDLKSLEIKDWGSVPGYPLNQFSMDEYQDNLRIATTMAGNFGLMDGGNSVSDVYILDDKLKIMSSVTDLGLGERIYSVRFIEDRGYVVTFKRIDPFYVLDLSSPKNPKKTGELKIPGYSSYLHPLEKNLILGVGNEDGKTKLSLFSVGEPDNPIESDKYSLDEYYTEVQNNHHAFMIDEKNKLFFIPAGKGGYVFSYSDQKLNLAKAISESGIKRGLYVDDYFYAIAENGISVYDINNWESIGSLDF